MEVSDDNRLNLSQNTLLQLNWCNRLDGVLLAETAQKMEKRVMVEHVELVQKFLNSLLVDNLPLPERDLVHLRARLLLTDHGFLLLNQLHEPCQEHRALEVVHLFALLIVDGDELLHGSALCHDLEEQIVCVDIHDLYFWLFDQSVWALGDLFH